VISQSRLCSGVSVDAPMALRKSIKLIVHLSASGVIDRWEHCPDKRGVDEVVADLNAIALRLRP